MARMTTWLWVALAGAVLQLVALGSDFYTVKGDNGPEPKDAWLGIPHASDLILISALVAIALVALTAAGRNPLRGRKAGLTIGIVGLLASLQLGYRMIAPPFGGTLDGSQTISLFGSCQWYCAPSDAVDAKLLTGIWIGLAGCVLVALSGFLHAFSRTARETPAQPTVAATQPGMTPWLGLAAIGSVAQFVFGFTFFITYTTKATGGGKAIWSGWIPTPHTSSLVLAISVIVLMLVRAASRRRSPLSPSAVGAVIAALGFVAGVRILYRLIEPPFGSDGTTIGVAGYLSVAGAALVVIAGIVQAQTTREPAPEPERTPEAVAGPI
ncbi:MAG: hypothetical protein ACR2LH_08885 [Thermoleophilaceae bacterium]